MAGHLDGPRFARRAPRPGSRARPARPSRSFRPEHDEAPPGQAGRGFVTRSAELTGRHLTTTARMSRAERMRYSSPEYLTSVPPYLL